MLKWLRKFSLIFCGSHLLAYLLTYLLTYCSIIVLIFHQYVGCTFACHPLFSIATRFGFLRCLAFSNSDSHSLLPVAKISWVVHSLEVLELRSWELRGCNLYLSAHVHTNEVYFHKGHFLRMESLTALTKTFSSLYLSTTHYRSRGSWIYHSVGDMRDQKPWEPNIH